MQTYYQALISNYYSYYKQAPNFIEKRQIIFNYVNILFIAHDNPQQPTTFKSIPRFSNFQIFVFNNSFDKELLLQDFCRLVDV